MLVMINVIYFDKFIPEMSISANVIRTLKMVKYSLFRTFQDALIIPEVTEALYKFADGLFWIETTA